MMRFGYLLVIHCAIAMSGQTAKEEAIEIAREALQEKAGVSLASVRVRRAEAVEWPDSSLGCPEEGKVYGQVVTPGYRLLMEAEGKLYRVHVGGGEAIGCGNAVERRAPKGREDFPERVPRQEETGITGEVPDDILDSILEDVVERTGADPDVVDVLKAEEIVWRDGSLGCAEPGRNYPQAPVPGYWVILTNEGKRFDYRANDRGHFFLCERSSPSDPRRPDRKAVKPPKK